MKIRRSKGLLKSHYPDRLPLTPMTLTPLTINRVRAKMLGVPRDDGLPGVYSDGVTFTEYMEEFERLDPDVIYFTANSAIPVADSVRGYYEHKGLDTPILRAINVSGKTAYLLKNHVGIDELLQDEITRINMLDRSRSGVIIDQAVKTCSTIRLARHVLQEADVEPMASTDEAVWYHQANLSAEHVNGLTSHCDRQYACDRCRSGRPNNNASKSIETTNFNLLLRSIMV